MCPPGFTGTDCDIPISSCTEKPCLNAGTCVEDTYNRNYRCDCRTGWSGRHCEDRTVTCAEKPCQHGTCHDTATGFQCTCPQGYSGTNCEIQVDDCNPSPCENSGTCIRKADSFKCSCQAGFSGKRCEQNVDDCHGAKCFNGGTCIDMVNQYRCQCVPGFIGTNCADIVDLCITKPCANGGSCINLSNDYRCVCRAGFTGKDCSVDIDECLPEPCKNGGTCVNRVNSYHCVCPNGFRGTQCAEEAFTASAVSNSQQGMQSIGRKDELSNGQIIAIAILSVSVPAIALIATCIVICMKKQRKRAQEKDDAEARKQNEQNATQNMHHGNSMISSKRSSSTGLSFDNTIQPPTIIKNTWDKSVNNVSGSTSVDECLMNTSLYGGMSNYSDNTISSDCFSAQQTQHQQQQQQQIQQQQQQLQQSIISPLQRARSQKQLNTDPSVMHRASQIIHQPKEFLIDHKRISVVAGSCSAAAASQSPEVAFCNQRWSPTSPHKSLHQQRQCVP